jgi:protein-S-isoprenylcysteine O-methyltransferase Ste14
MQGAVVSLAVGLAGIGNLFLWCHLEEQHLETSFGEAYRAYRAKTWFQNRLPPARRRTSMLVPLFVT